jgi:hypothetical protein
MKTIKLMTRDVSQMTGLSEARILQLADSGALRCTRALNGFRLFSLVDVVSLIDERRARSAARTATRTEDR